MIRSGGHQFRLESDARGICLQDRGSSGIVPAVDGAGYAAVQVASVAGKGDQVNHWICPQFYRSLTVAALPEAIAIRLLYTRPNRGVKNGDSP
jgi:hypothetical protein